MTEVCMNHADNEAVIVLAGDRISCNRCQAKAKRSGQQCKKPALRGRRVCQVHGGRSTGPRTQDGKARSAAANFRTGEFSRAEIEKTDRHRALVTILEEATHLLKMTHPDTPRTRGRKPRLYLPLTCPEDVLQAILELRD